MDGYRLIKVGFTAEGEMWFGRYIGQDMTEKAWEQLQEEAAEAVLKEAGEKPGRTQAMGMLGRLLNFLGIKRGGVRGEEIEGKKARREGVQGEGIEGKRVKGEGIQGGGIKGKGVKREGVQGNEIKGERVQRGDIEGKRAKEKGVQGEEGKRNKVKKRGARGEEKKKEERLQERLEELLAEREAELSAAEEQRAAAASYLIGKAVPGGSCSYLCQGTLEKSPAWSWWLKGFPVGKFSEFQQRFWVERLMEQGKNSRLILLGRCDEIYDILERYAPRLKSLEWFLREEECGEAVYEFVEGFYIEYGIAVRLQTVSGRNPYRHIRLEAAQPVDILDFTNDTVVCGGAIPEGSIWLDVFSLEEKQRRLELRGSGIRYASLREWWHRA